MLAELDIDNVLDLLTTYPRRYIDRTRQADVSDLVVGDEAAVLAAVQSASSRRSRQGRAMLCTVAVWGAAFAGFAVAAIAGLTAWRHRPGGR